MNGLKVGQVEGKEGQSNSTDALKVSGSLNRYDRDYTLPAKLTTPQNPKINSKVFQFYLSKHY